jgi:ligand-binding SRPBCC domain-containing protein
MGRIHQLSRTQLLARPRSEVFALFSDASNLEALTPPFLHFRILTPMPIEMRADARLDYQLSLFGVPVRWRTRITDWQPGRRFVDEQESGHGGARPFRSAHPRPHLRLQARCDTAPA